MAGKQTEAGEASSALTTDRMLGGLGAVRQRQAKCMAAPARGHCPANKSQALPRRDALTPLLSSVPPAASHPSPPLPQQAQRPAPPAAAPCAVAAAAAGWRIGLRGWVLPGGCLSDPPWFPRLRVVGQQGQHTFGGAAGATHGMPASVVEALWGRQEMACLLACCTLAAVAVVAAVGYSSGGSSAVALQVRPSPTPQAHLCLHRASTRRRPPPCSPSCC